MDTQQINDFAKKHPLALGCMFLSIVLAAGIYFRRDALAEARVQLDAKTTEGEHVTDNVKNSAQLGEQYAALTQATQMIESRLVHADQLAINLQYFYKLEADTQTKLTDLRQNGVAPVGKNAGKTAYSAIGYTVLVDGSYPQLLDFLRRIENGEHFSRIRNLRLSRAGNGSNPDNLSLKLELDLLGI
ncbi:MAG TPA: hypothetical protein VK717_11765 [Opitutaceae bacterium]|jgi:hypothetical protein|nr:hypothetical protein [Opitutaceae bacterium]